MATRAGTAVLRAPLVVKLLGANMMLILGAIGAHFLLPDASIPAELAALLVLSLTVTAVLTWLALRPLRLLQATTDRVWDGDFAARVPTSPLADREVTRLASTVNRLLDRVQADRARIQYLAGRNVRARDIERQHVAHELRESLAQQVAGISLQLSAARSTRARSELHDRLEHSRALLEDLGGELRSIAETLYPGTLGEFGLPNALRTLARMTERRTGMTIDVDVADSKAIGQLDAAIAGALYRVADEALRNAAQHARAPRAAIHLRTAAEHVILEVSDDGAGFDTRVTDPLQLGLGLFSAQAVLALSKGELQISSAPGQGTRVIARVPGERARSAS